MASNRFGLKITRYLTVVLLVACRSSSEDSGDSSSTLCRAYEHVVNHACIPCAEGSINEAGEDPNGEDTSCEVCEAGSFDAGDSLCEPCEPGYYSEIGETACTACSAGTYEDENECVDCELDFTADEGATECHLEASGGYLDLRDYGFLFWPGNHWVSWGTYFNVQHVQTGYYGLAFDVSAGSFDHLGLISDTVSAAEALSSDNTLVTELSTANVSYALVKNGNEHRGAQSFLNTSGTTSNPSELIDMGRFMQRVRIPQVLYADSDGYKGAIELAALPRQFTLTHSVVNEAETADLTVSIEIDGEAVEQFTEIEFLEGTRAVSISNSTGDGWSFIIPEKEGVTSVISRFGDGGIAFKSTFESVAAGEEMALSVTAVPSHAATDAQLAFLLNPEEVVKVQYAQLNRDGSGGEALKDAVWDAQRGLYVIELGNLTDVGAPTWPDWNDPDVHNWYNRHRFVISNLGGDSVPVPIAFDGGNNAAFYITGGSPLLRDSDGEPIGVPVQISKNWHETPYWYHLYTSLEVEPGSHEFEHTFAHSKWGETYAAQHAQLALVGWGQNQQWDESSLGAWGESITYDPDLTLSRSMVDDVRPFLVDTQGEWSWTGNVGGASFLVYESAEGYSSHSSHQLERMRTHYAYTGPNLTKVLYAGQSRDGKIEAKIETQLGRTDDLVRAYYHLTYTFLEDVTYDRLALFQIAADRYSDNGFTQYAYGNASEVVFDETIPNHGATHYGSESDRGIPLDGEAPWVMLYDSVHTSGNLPENLANIGFVVRDYEAQIGGVVTEQPHINIVRTYNGGWSQMGFELGVPYDASAPIIPAGSVITATVEYLVPPADKSAYFGESDYLVAMTSDQFQSTEMMLKLANDNQLDVVATVGEVVRIHPVEVDCVSDVVAAQFSLDGGLGYTPVTFHGLIRPDGWRLEKFAAGTWTRVSQEVEGNDYWQAYEDSTTGLFDLVFNVHNRTLEEYRLTR
jgi:hypothetical protein